MKQNIWISFFLLLFFISISCRIYEKDDLTDDEGMRIGELEEQFGEMQKS